MKEGQERDSSSDEQRHIIDDDDMEDSPTDSPDLWMPERNEEDTMFERALNDSIPTKKHPQTVSELSIGQQRKNLFKDLVKGGNETLTLSVTDQYFRDVVRPIIWKKNPVTFPNGKEWEINQKHTHTHTHTHTLVNMYIFTIVRTRTCYQTTIPMMWCF
jgi:hypothetical protein